MGPNASRIPDFVETSRCFSSSELPKWGFCWHFCWHFWTLRTSCMRWRMNYCMSPLKLLSLQITLSPGHLRWVRPPTKGCWLKIHQDFVFIICSYEIPCIISIPHFPLYLERPWGGCFAMLTGWLEFWVELSPKNAAFFKGPNLLANYTNLSRKP